MTGIRESLGEHVGWLPVGNNLRQICSALVLPALAIVAINFAGIMENDLGDAFTDRNHHAFLTIQVIHLHGPAIYVARITPASIKTGGYAIPAPAAATLHL